MIHVELFATGTHAQLLGVWEELRGGIGAWLAARTRPHAHLHHASQQVLTQPLLLTWDTSSMLDVFPVVLRLLAMCETGLHAGSNANSTVYMEERRDSCGLVGMMMTNVTCYVVGMMTDVVW